MRVERLVGRCGHPDMSNCGIAAEPITGSCDAKLALHAIERSYDNQSLAEKQFSMSGLEGFPRARVTVPHSSEFSRASHREIHFVIRKWTYRPRVVNGFNQKIAKIIAGGGKLRSIRHEPQTGGFARCAH